MNVLDASLISRADAIRLGLKSYFTGEPCKQGHIAKRSVKSYSCYGCMEECHKRSKLTDRKKYVLRRRASYLRCIEQRKIASKAYAAANKERIAKRMREWHRVNKVRLRAIRKKWEESHQKHLTEYRRKYRTRRAAEIKKYYETNKYKFTSKRRERQAAQLLAMPAWADKKAMSDIAKEALLISRRTGIKHHVDHIIPLKGKSVCGLHVEYNLQIVTATENLRKGNRLLEAA